MIISQDTGECKGYAFIQFPSIEYSVYFMTLFAGSAGDPKAPQLIVDMRAVTLEYSRDDGNERKDKLNRFNEKSSEDIPAKKIRTDWLCDCGCQNFAKRTECFRCGVPKPESFIPLTSAITGADMFSDAATSSNQPSTYLVVKGFGPYNTEDQLTELFRQYALVKSSMIIRDPMTGTSRGIALIEFHSIDFAKYVLKNTNDLQLDKNKLKVNYAKESFVNQQLTPQTSNPIGFQQFNIHAVVPNIWNTSTLPQQRPPLQYQTNTALPKVKSIWPPDFETHGASYTFQSQSGYFWEGYTQFYYCPKSKLYYNTNDGSYYRYDNTQDPPFIRFIPPAPIEPFDPNYNPNKDDNVVTTSETVTKKPVVMSLGKQKSKTTNITIGPPKKIVDDIAKWEARKDEDQQTNDSAFLKASNVTLSASNVTSQGIENNTSSDTTNANNTNTITTGFVCLLCRRKFNSADQLQRHENESKLHAENLAKSKATELASSSVENTGPVYRDRASERRSVFGIGDPVITTVRPEKSSSRDKEIIPQAPVIVSEDMSNPGNQLLRKMGWSEGQGLGKDGKGVEVPIAVDQSDITRGTVGIGGPENFSSVYNRDNYRESILKAARARYDSLNK
mmetsp:Transcript_22236/g.20211  ORF Transcript_22236/g.20211 Transcript_22236/m.20211 type:complete len:617 (+) Transcript_22236:3-1853(+)